MMIPSQEIWDRMSAKQKRQFVQNTKPLLNKGKRWDECILRLEDVEDPVVAEVGVWEGTLSKHLCKIDGIDLHLIDAWDAQQYSDNSKDDKASYTLEQYQEAFAKVQDLPATVHKTTSVEAAGLFPDESFDLVFIDADHAYEAVKQDLNAWWDKVKPGSWIGGHDYKNGFGVEHAVDEFFTTLPVIEGADSVWWVRKPIKKTEVKYKIVSVWFDGSETFAFEGERQGKWAERAKLFEYSARLNCPGADVEVIKIDNDRFINAGSEWGHESNHKKFVEWHRILHETDVPIILADVDMIVLNDLEPLLDMKLDLALAYRQDRQRINAGLIFARPTDEVRHFFDVWKKWNDKLMYDRKQLARRQKKHQGMNQPALIATEKELKRKMTRLPSVWNELHADAVNIIRTKVFHVKGKARKTIEYGERNPRPNEAHALNVYKAYRKAAGL